MSESLSAVIRSENHGGLEPLQAFIGDNARRREAEGVRPTAATITENGLNSRCAFITTDLNECNLIKGRRGDNGVCSCVPSKNTLNIH